MLKTWEKNLLKHSLRNIERLVDGDNLYEVFTAIKEFGQAIEAMKASARLEGKPEYQEHNADS